MADPIELLSRARVAVFDFDGTLSTIRSGWADIMIEMIREVLPPSVGDENFGREFVGRTTGKSTIEQMMELADQVKEHGGKPRDPVELKRTYLERLDRLTRSRTESLRTGETPPDRYVVPGSRAMLESLQQRGLTLYLASGTDHDAVLREAALLDIARYFDGGMFGALDDPETFTKRMLVQKLVHQLGFSGHEIVGFGDGPVETANVHEVGGLAVGLATDEPDCLRINEDKRTRLIASGADWIVPNYLPLLGAPRTLLGYEQPLSRV